MAHNWYAVLPAKVLLSKELTDKQKLLIALISNLSNERGYCFASNRYLGECLDCSESTIKEHLKKLEDMGILGRVIKLKENGEVEFRSLIITIEIPQPEFTTTPAEKITHPPAENLAHNNKEYNNKVNKEYSAKDAFVSRVEEFKNKLGNEYNRFINYWTESNAKGKMRFQGEKYFDINRRINTWIERSEQNTYNKSNEIIDPKKVKIRPLN